MRLATVVLFTGNKTVKVT